MSRSKSGKNLRCNSFWLHEQKKNRWDSSVHYTHLIPRKPLECPYIRNHLPDKVLLFYGPYGNIARRHTAHSKEFPYREGGRECIDTQLLFKNFVLANWDGERNSRFWPTDLPICIGRDLGLGASSGSCALRLVLQGADYRLRRSEDSLQIKSACRWNL